MMCFIFHDWGLWTKPIAYKTEWSGTTLRQLRECGRCGKVKARTIEYLDVLDTDGDEIGQ